MSTDPKRIAVQVALRALQLDGSNQAELENSYQTGFTALDGADVPASALVDAIVAIEGQLADLIGGDKRHPYRNVLYARSDDIASGEQVPTESEDGVMFVGVFSEINSSDDGLPLKEDDVAVIRRFLRGGYTTEIYKYAMLGSSIVHTRDAVYFEGCAWSRTQARARFAPTATAPSPIPTAFEPAWVSMTLAFLAQEGWFIPEAQHYGQIATQSLAMIKNRETELPSLPSAKATAAPGVN
jgi:hypothetical protein